jgi:hypothetical protein
MAQENSIITPSEIVIEDAATAYFGAVQYTCLRGAEVDDTGANRSGRVIRCLKPAILQEDFSI